MNGYYKILLVYVYYTVSVKSDPSTIITKQVHKADKITKVSYHKVLHFNAQES